MDEETAVRIQLQVRNSSSCRSGPRPAAGRVFHSLTAIPVAGSGQVTPTIACAAARPDPAVSSASRCRLEPVLSHQGFLIYPTKLAKQASTQAA